MSSKLQFPDRRHRHVCHVSRELPEGEQGWKVGRQFAPPDASKTSGEARIPPVRTISSEDGQSVGEPIRRTSQPSGSLLSPQPFSVKDADQLRQLMHESLTSLAVEIGRWPAVFSKKSSVSRNFVEATREQVAAFPKRRFDETTFVAVFVDGIAFLGEMMVVARGVSDDGSKYVRGLVRGETENAEIVRSLLTNLRDRGLKISQPTLFCLDGSNALASAVKKVFGENAVIQRCQVHKIHNVESHVAAKHQPEVRRRMNEAYAQVHHADAKRFLLATVTWLKTINPDAAASLKEGLDETITVIRLGLEGELK